MKIFLRENANSSVHQFFDFVRGHHASLNVTLGKRANQCVTTLKSSKIELSGTVAQIGSGDQSSFAASLRPLSEFEPKRISAQKLVHPDFPVNDEQGFPMRFANSLGTKP